MTKEEIIQSVKDIVGMSYGDRTVAFHIGNVFNSVVGQLFARDQNQWQFYCKRIKITGKNRVFPLTVPIIQTAASSKGVPRVMPIEADGWCADDTEFYPMPEWALHSSTDANSLSQFGFYTVTNSMLRFNKALPKEVTELLADVVLEFSGYDNKDQISLPTGTAQMIIDGAAASLRGDQSHKNIYKPPA